MNSKHAQTRYQLVQTYFINISTTNHRARAVRIHPSRAVFRKDEKFSESLYILGGNPKNHPTRAGKKRKSAVFLAPFTRAILTTLYHLSLEKLIIIADDKREYSMLTFAILFLCLQYVLMKLNFERGSSSTNQTETSEKKEKKIEEIKCLDWNLSTSAVKCGERRYYSEGSRA